MKADFWKKKYPPTMAHEIDVDCYPDVLTIFGEACHKFKNNRAFTHNNHSLTYQELNHLSTQLAAYLQQLPFLKKGDRIALQMPNILQYPVAVFAIMKAGFILVNTNPLYSHREMHHQFKDAGVKVVICITSVLDKMQKILAETDIQQIIVTDIEDLFGSLEQIALTDNHKSFSLPNSIHFNKALTIGENTVLKELDFKPDDIAILQYTGGTTGVVKAAILTHRNLVANILQCKEFLASTVVEGQEVAIAPLPMYHIYAFTLHCLLFLMLGFHTILIENPRELNKLVKALNQHPVSFFIGVNTLFAALCNNEEFKQLDFSKLKMTISGGMGLQPSINEYWKRITNMDICEGYGLTETAPVVSLNFIENIRVGSIGIPLPSTLCKVIDEQGNELPLGVAGELCIKGPQVMQGYWQSPAETALVLDSDGWLKTGDIGIIAEDGYITIIDRKKDIILVSGFNVYPSELEDILAKLSDVQMVAAIGVPDQYAGEAIKIFVTLKEQAKLTEADIMEYFYHNLAHYKCPKYIEFREQLPINNVGKVLKRELREQELKHNPRVS